MADNTKRHYDPGCGAQHAPCGTRIGSVISELIPQPDGRLKYVRHEPLPIESSSKALADVTCGQCKLVIRAIHQAYGRSRRKKAVAW